MVKEYGCHGADKMVDYWSALKASCLSMQGLFCVETEGNSNFF